MCHLHGKGPDSLRACEPKVAVLPAQARDTVAAAWCSLWSLADPVSREEAAGEPWVAETLNSVLKFLLTDPLTTAFWLPPKNRCKLEFISPSSKANSSLPNSQTPDCRLPLRTAICLFYVTNTCRTLALSQVLC